MNNEIEQIAQQNDMSVEFVHWFFNEKKADCGEQWFLALGAMWEGWKAREGEVTALAMTLEKSREAAGCPDGVDLQDWVKQLAEQRDASLNAERAWESVVMEVCGEDGQESVAAVINALTALAAENAALKEDRDTLARYWIEDGGDKDCAMSYCEPTPATDRIVAGIKADGVEEFSKTLEGAADICGKSKAWEAQENLLEFAERGFDFAKQLREGAGK